MQLSDRFQFKKLTVQTIWVSFLLFFVLSCFKKSAAPPLRHNETSSSSGLIAEVLMRVQLDYVDPNRLVPQRSAPGCPG